MGGRECEKMGRKRNGEGKKKRKNGREERGKLASVCVWVEEKKNGRINEGVVVCVEKKMEGRVEKLREVRDAPVVSGVWGKKWRRMGNGGAGRESNVVSRVGKKKRKKKNGRKMGAAGLGK